MVVVNKFKQVFSLIPGLHSRKLPIMDLLNGRRIRGYKDLEGPNGRQLSVEMKDLFADYASDKFSDIDGPRSEARK